MIKTALTKKEIVDILRNNGLETGMIVEVHCSLSSTGYIVGGAQTLVDALMEVVGYQGTILMPVHSAHNSEPTFWNNPLLYMVPKVILLYISWCCWFLYTTRLS